MNKTAKQQQQQQVFTGSNQMAGHQIYSTGATTMPANFAQTISRSNNLHQQIFGHPQQLQQQQQIQTSRKNSVLMNNYDQPMIHHPQAYHPHLSSLTLAARPSKERQPLPLHMTNFHHQTLPSNRFQPHQQQQQQQIYQEPHLSQHNNHLMSLIEQQARLNKPLCRCRVMYLGSSVPHITKNGLHGIQEPLRHLYPEEQFSPMKLKTANNARQPLQMQNQQQVAENTIDISHLSSSLGIDSWLSVWSNGLLLENVDEFGREIKRFFSIESLHYCAAVRYFDTSTLMKTSDSDTNAEETSTNGIHDANNNQDGSPAEARDSAKKGVVRFLPLDAPIFQCPGMLDANHPPVFGAIMRRTTGIKVLECHAFICRRDAAANALVRCCTHAYADFLSAKRLSVELGCSSMPQTGAYAYYASPQETTNFASKSQRSSSVGRRRHNHQQSAATPAYQVVEAIINNPAVHKPAKGSHSSGGPASQETDDNSMDNSSQAGDEENYAIISKQQQHRSNNGKRSSRHAARKAKGSSKSLFYDFQPVIRHDVDDPGNYNQQQAGIDRLSHSLDYLQCCQLQQQHQQQQQQYDQRTLTNNNQRNSRSQQRDFDGDQNTVSYSIVKNKRHSRSMQNLDGFFEFSASQARSSVNSRGRSRSSARRSNHKHQRGSSVSSSMAGDMVAAGKKAASCQDMSALRRKGSVSSQATIHSYGSQRRPELENGPHSIYDTCVDQENKPECNNNSNQEYPRILKAEGYLPPVPSSSSKTANSVQSGSSAKTAKVGAEKSSSSSSGHHRRSHKATPGHLNDGTIRSLPYTMMEPQHNTMGRQSRLPGAANFYAQPYGAAYAPQTPNGLYQSGPHHPIYLAQGPPPPPPPPIPYYIGPGAGPAYHHQPMYPASAIYESAQASPYPPVQLAHPHHNPYPAQCHTLNQIAASRAIYENGMATIANSGRVSSGNKKSLKSASASLATRFRCLSPPVNFLTNNSRDKKNKRDSHVEDVVRTNETHVVDRTSQQALVIDGTTVDGPLMTTSEQYQMTNGKQLDDSSINETVNTDIVSGPPGFIQQQQLHQQGAHNQPTKTGGKKLSWIKRLSLTMSSNGQNSGDDTSNTGTISSCNGQRVATSLSIDPCGSATTSEQQQPMNGDSPTATEAKQTKQKRKRSSFFGGSLTLGRSSNKSSTSKPTTELRPT